MTSTLNISVADDLIYHLLWNHHSRQCCDLPLRCAPAEAAQAEQRANSDQVNDERAIRERARTITLPSRVIC